MSLTSRVGGSILLGALLGGGLCGCAIAPYAGQTGALSSAAQAFKTDLGGASAVRDAERTLGQTQLLRSLSDGEPRPLDLDCAKRLRAPRNDLITAAASRSATAETAAYTAFLAVPACGPVPDTEAAVEPNGRTVVDALDGYLDGVGAIVSASSPKAVSDAAQALSTSVQGIATAADPGLTIPPAAPAFFQQLVTMALAQAQYRALRQVVLEVDPLLDRAAGPIASAMRDRRAALAYLVASDAARGMNTINTMMAKAKGDPKLELELYDRSAPLVADFGREQASVRGDPAEAVQDMIAAHHALAKALKSKHRQTRTLLAGAFDLATGVKALTEIP